MEEKVGRVIHVDVSVAIAKLLENALGSGHCFLVLEHECLGFIEDHHAGWQVLKDRAELIFLFLALFLLDE